MESSFFQWLVEWVWVPVFALMGELFRRLFKLEAKHKDTKADRERHEEYQSTAIRNIESGVHNLGERLANIEGYLDGKK